MVVWELEVGSLQFRAVREIDRSAQFRSARIRAARSSPLCLIRTRSQALLPRTSRSRRPVRCRRKRRPGPLAARPHPSLAGRPVPSLSTPHGSQRERACRSAPKNWNVSITGMFWTCRMARRLSILKSTRALDVEGPEETRRQDAAVEIVHSATPNRGRTSRFKPGRTNPGELRPRTTYSPSKARMSVSRL